MQPTRRQFLTTAAGFIISHALMGRVALGQKKSTRVVLLGTKGGPRVGEAGRSNPSTLILINDVPYLVDCGYGVTKQLITTGVALDRLRYIFITHHHSDHNLEFGHLDHRLAGANRRLWSAGADKDGLAILRLPQV